MAQTTHARETARAARFAAKIEPGPGGCWNWTGALMPNGYGRFKGEPRAPMLAHRWSYEWHVGPIPAGLDLDHLCRNRSCVNPWHLEPVTRRENLRRGIHHNAVKVECSQGHPYPTGKRRCRICDRAAEARYRLRRDAKTA